MDQRDFMNLQLLLIKDSLPGLKGSQSCSVPTQNGHGPSTRTVGDGEMCHPFSQLHQEQDGFLSPTCGPDVGESESVSDSALGEASLVGFDRNQPNHLNPELWETEEKNGKR